MGISKDGEKTIPVSMRLTESTVADIDTLGAEWGLPRTKVVEMAVRQFLKANGIAGIIAVPTGKSNLKETMEDHWRTAGESVLDTPYGKITSTTK